jgi:hypothetical protein
MALGTALAIGSTVAGLIGSNKAAKAQEKASNRSNALQSRMYNDSLEFGAPYREAGANALAAYQSELGLGEAPETYAGFQQAPGYQFQLGEGMRAIEQGASARGLRLSSDTLKSGARFATGLADQQYGQHLNRLASLSGAGQTATGQQAALGQNYANAVGQNNRLAGDARASGYINQANALTGGFNNLAGIAGLNGYGSY